MTATSLIFDGICLLIVLLTAVYFSSKGGLTAVFSVVGTMVVFVLSLFGARTLAPIVFDYFFKDRLITGIQESVWDAGAQEPLLALEEFSQSLPKGLRESLLASADQVEAGTEGYVELLVNDVVKALLLPAIILILFIILFALLRPLVTLLVHMIRKGRGITKLKTPQKVAGALAGVFLGGLYVLLLVNVAAAVAPIMEFSFFQNGALQSSIFYRLFTLWGVLL